MHASSESAGLVAAAGAGLAQGVQPDIVEPEDGGFPSASFAFGSSEPVERLRSG